MTTVNELVDLATEALLPSFAAPPAMYCGVLLDARVRPPRDCADVARWVAGALREGQPVPCAGRWGRMLRRPIVTLCVRLHRMQGAARLSVDVEGVPVLVATLDNGEAGHGQPG